MTFYIYVDGSDLEEVAPRMRARIDTFVAPYGDRVRVVDQRAVKEPTSADLPNWDLGVNFETDAVTDVEKKDLVLFFQSLSAEFDREFILGDTLPHGLSEDLVRISATEPLEPAIDLLLANDRND